MCERSLGRGCVIPVGLVHWVKHVLFAFVHSGPSRLIIVFGAFFASSHVSLAYGDNGRQARVRVARVTSPGELVSKNATLFHEPRAENRSVDCNYADKLIDC